MADLKLQMPEAKQIVTLVPQADDRLVLEFDSAQAELERDNDNLVFVFNKGNADTESRIILENFYVAYTSENMPEFEIQDAIVPGEAFFAALGEDLMPAAGPAAAAPQGSGTTVGFASFGAGDNGVDSLGNADINGFASEGVEIPFQTFGLEAIDNTPSSVAPGDGGIPPVPPITPPIIPPTPAPTPPEPAPTATLRGDDTDNMNLAGTAGADAIYGYAGNDRISGYDGDDYINGGDDNDTIYGEKMNDFNNANAGNDTILGGKGNDTIEGNGGNDLLFGEEGNDTLYGDGRFEFIELGNGDDFLNGGEGDDDLFGGFGNDFLYSDTKVGNVTGDEFYGGAGNDLIKLDTTLENITLEDVLSVDGGADLDVLIAGYTDANSLNKVTDVEIIVSGGTVNGNSVDDVLASLNIDVDNNGDLVDTNGVWNQTGTVGAYTEYTDNNNMTILIHNTMNATL